jgi:hypothetical protein
MIQQTEAIESYAIATIWTSVFKEMVFQNLV